MAGNKKDGMGKQKSNRENADSVKQRGVRKTADGRKKMAGQCFWGVLTVFSLFVMFAAGIAAAGTVSEKNSGAVHPVIAAAMDSLLMGQGEMMLYAMEPGKESAAGVWDGMILDSDAPRSFETDANGQQPSGKLDLSGGADITGDGELDVGGAEKSNMENIVKTGPEDAVKQGEDAADPEPNDEAEPQGKTKEDVPEGPVIAFTFDDGPFTPVTNRILDVLLEYNAGATFFVVGSRLEMYSDTLKRIYEDGFEVASHTWSHKNLNKLSETEIAEEIGNTVDQINVYIPVGNVLLRPPYGNANETVRALAGTSLINWSLDSQDWKSRDADKIVKHVLDTVRDGDIILMHDLYECTAEAVESLVPELTARGYRLVSVSELFRLKNIPLEEGILYRKPGDHY